MAEYIEREAVLSEVDKAFKLFSEHDEIIRLYSDVRSAVIYETSADVVSRAAYEQVRWERDLAVTQLKDDYGVGLGEKKKVYDPVVRCGQCKFDNLCCRNIGKDGKRTKDDFCSYGVKKE